MYSFGQQLDETGGLVVVGWVVDAVTVEYHEVVIHVFHLLEQCLEYLVPLVKVVEYDGGKGIRIVLGSGE